MRRYAEHVAGKGIYLSLADLFLLCQNFNKDAYVVFYDDELPEAPPVCRRLVEIMNGAFDRTNLPTFDVPQSGDVQHVDAWVFATCKADFQRSSFVLMNHYMPLYQKKILGDQWESDVTNLKERNVCFRLPSRCDRNAVSKVENISDENNNERP